MSLHVERDGAVTTIIRSRVEARNAMDPASADALHDALVAFDRDPSQHVAVLWGAGGAFCAGWDLKHVSTLTAKERLAALDFPKDGGPAPRGPLGPTRLELTKPVIAAVAGPAVAGGMELALWCDLRVAARDAVLGVFNRRFGVPLIDGGTVRLPRLIGEARAMDLILTGRPVGAEEALRIGLVSRVVENGEALNESMRLARQLASFPQGAMRADRRSVKAQQSLQAEHEGGMKVIESGESQAGAAEFAKGKGRHGQGA